MSARARDVTLDLLKSAESSSLDVGPSETVEETHPKDTGDEYITCN